MKTLMIISTILFLNGCLFFDTTTSTCEDTNTCIETKAVYGEFLEHYEECAYFADACAENDCVGGGGFSNCEQFIKIAIVNPATNTAMISEPEFLDLYSENGNTVDTVDINQFFIEENADGPQISAGNSDGDSSGFKRVLELRPDERIELTLSFSLDTFEPIAATANVVFDVQDQDNLIIQSDPIKFGISPLEQPSENTPEVEKEQP